jgi:hypothetical protein
MLKGSRSFVRSPIPIISGNPAPIDEIEGSKRDRKIDHAQDQPVQRLVLSLIFAFEGFDPLRNYRSAIHIVGLSVHGLFETRRIEQRVPKSDDECNHERPSPRDADSDFAESVIRKVRRRSNLRWLWFGLVACLSTICGLPGLRSATRSTIRP